MSEQLNKVAVSETEQVDAVARAVERLNTIEANGLSGERIAEIQTLIDELVAENLRYPEGSGMDPTELLKGSVDVVSTPIPGEPRELALAKLVVRGIAQLPDKPIATALPVEDRGMYTVWQASDDKSLLTDALEAAGKGSLIEDFEALDSYEEEKAEWDTDAANIVSSIDTLIDLLRHARAFLTNKSAPANGAKSSTPRAQSRKIQPGDPNAYYADCPVCGKTHVSRQAAHVISNLSKHCKTEHPETDCKLTISDAYQKGEDGVKTFNL